MDIATVKSSYNIALEAYTASINTINSWRKRVDVMLILAAPISLILLRQAFSHLNSRGYGQMTWERFAVAGFMAVVAFICGIIAWKVRAFNDLPPISETESEQEYELALEDTLADTGENRKLFNQQKQFTLFSLCLFLISDIAAVLAFI